MKRLKGYGLLSYYAHGKSRESKVTNTPLHEWWHSRYSQYAQCWNSGGKKLKQRLQTCVWPMQHLLEQLFFFSFSSNTLTFELKTLTLLRDSNCQKLQRSSRIIVSHCLKNRRTNTLQTDAAALTWKDKHETVYTSYKCYFWWQRRIKTELKAKGETEWSSRSRTPVSTFKAKEVKCWGRELQLHWLEFQSQVEKTAQ